jgi:hypothetical protein
VRGRPPGLGGGSNGARMAHSRSLRFVGKGVEVAGMAYLLVVEQSSPTTLSHPDKASGNHYRRVA